MSMLDRFFKKNEDQNQNQEQIQSQEIEKKVANLRERITAIHHPGSHKVKGARLDGVPYGAKDVPEIEEALNANDGKKLDAIKERLLREMKERYERSK